MTDQMEQIAELRVRKYFDYHMKEILPKILKSTISAHNTDPAAHESVARRVNRMTWMLMGALLVGGAGGATATRLLLSL